MADDKMLTRKQGAIGYIVFNNPKRHNAVSLEMWQATESILEDVLADAAIRIIVLSGAGGKAFVSGADISKFESERATKEAVASYNATTDRVYAILHEAAKPTIAMIQGHCVGGGLALAVCCDLRICTENSEFSLPAAKLGLGYPFAGLKRLADVVGIASAKEICFTGRRFDADEALALGLVQRVLPAEKIEDFVNEYAVSIAENAPLTVSSMKQTFNEMTKDTKERNLALCRALVDECFASDDYKEGRRAFLEKRKPVFQGS